MRAWLASCAAGGWAHRATAVVNALRALLAGQDEPYRRLDVDDVHHPKAGKATGDIVFQYVFRGLGSDDETDLLAALKPGSAGYLEAHSTVCDCRHFLGSPEWIGIDRAVDV